MSLAVKDIEVPELKLPDNLTEDQIATAQAQRQAAIAQLEAHRSGAAFFGGVNSVLQGAQGASRLISNTIGSIADTLLPGIGGAVSNIITVLQGGPEQVRETVRAFVSAIPGIIENIILAIPALISAFAEQLPQAARVFAENMPRVAIEFAKSMPIVATEFALLMPNVAVEFVSGLISNAPRFVEALIDAINPFSSDGGVLGGIPVVGDIIGGIGGVLDSLNPFAEGGRIPDVAQFRNDGAVIRADAGEQIFSRDLSNRLEAFLNQQGGQGQTMQVNLVVDGQVLADVILDLNRNGARLA